MGVTTGEEGGGFSEDKLRPRKIRLRGMEYIKQGSKDSYKSVGL